MKKFSVFLLSAFTLLTLNAQDFNAEFTKALRDGDTVKQQEILSLWDKSEDRSPDYYIANFNYNFNQAQDNTVIMTNEKPQYGEYITISDTISGTVGYLTSGGVREDLLRKALKYIDEGIGKYPSRLDMRCGKIYSLYRSWRWDDFTKEIIKAIDYSYIIGNKWIYPDENADKDFFLSIVQEYQTYLFDEVDLEEYKTEDSLQVMRIREISQTVLKYYTDNVEALNNIGATYFFNSEPSKALEFLLKAEKIDQKDAIIKFNIANIYAKQGDKSKAKQYYEDIIKNCDNEAAFQAEELMKQL